MRGGFYLASKEASKSTFRCKHGAIIIHKGKIVAKAANFTHYTPPIMKLRYKVPKAHAEVRALKKAGFIGDTLVVTRVKKDGGYTNSKPCINCMKTIKESNIKCIIYTDNNGSIKIEEI